MNKTVTYRDVRSEFDGSYQGVEEVVTETPVVPPTRITLSRRGCLKGQTATGRAVLAEQAQRAADASGIGIEMVTPGGVVLARAWPRSPR